MSADTGISPFWILRKLGMMEVVVTTGAVKTCKAPVKSSPPTNQHPAFYMPDALPSPNQECCQNTEGKYLSITRTEQHRRESVRCWAFHIA